MLTTLLSTLGCLTVLVQSSENFSTSTVKQDSTSTVKQDSTSTVKQAHYCTYNFDYASVDIKEQHSLPTDYELQLHIYDVTDVANPKELDLLQAPVAFNTIITLVDNYKPVVRAYVEAHYSHDIVTKEKTKLYNPIVDFSHYLTAVFSGQESPVDEFSGADYLFDELYPQLPRGSYMTPQELEQQGTFIQHPNEERQRLLNSQGIILDIGPF